MELFSKSGVNCIGQSKHTAKKNARAAGAIGWQDIGMSIGVYSFGTADAYREVWIQFMRFAKQEYGMKDLEAASPMKIRKFLEKKIDDGVALATFAQYASACVKLGKALELYAEKTKSTRKYNFVGQINECRVLARRVLVRFEGVRAYDSPFPLIEAIDQGIFRAGALIQVQSGARLSEMALIRYEQLLGVWQDDITGEDRGCVSIKGKGGKETTIFVHKYVYDYILSYIQKYGIFKVDKYLYRKLIRQAAWDTNQPYSGSHGLRWNFARFRMRECQQIGMCFNSSLLRVSREMGHERASITKHYLG